MIAFLMIDRAAIARQSQSANAFGATQVTLAAEHASDVPCRIDYIRHRREIAPNAMAEVGDPLLFLPLGTDIMMNDVVTVSPSDGPTVKFIAVSVRPAAGFHGSHIEIIGKVTA